MPEFASHPVEVRGRQQEESFMVNRDRKLEYLVKLAVLTAIVLLMAYTPLGYLKVGALSITFIVIPVAIGGIILGPAAGAFLGLVFGLTSFAQCFGTDPFGMALLAIDPVRTFIMCILPRVICGFGSAYIFKLLKKIDKTKLLSYIGGSLAAPLLNTFLVLGSLIPLFGSSELIMGMRGNMNIVAFILTIAGVNGLVEAAACGVVSSAVAKAIDAATGRSRKRI